VTIRGHSRTPAGRTARRSGGDASYSGCVGIVGNSAADCGHGRVMEVSDSVLWSRSLAGDADAFGLLFEQYARVIYNFCFRRVGDWAVAEDLLSIVFLEAWRRRDKELPPGKVLPWLYGIATNVVRNRRRSERRFAAALRRMPRPDSEQGFDELADERLDDARQMRQALTLVERLPKHEQEVFVLCAWSRLSYEDAALALDIPIGTVRSRLFRARARLGELDSGFGH
jgi:RNA polymerase sigma factor (sigma-70 family)